MCRRLSLPFPSFLLLFPWFPSTVRCGAIPYHRRHINAPQRHRSKHTRTHTTKGFITRAARRWVDCQLPPCDQRGLAASLPQSPWFRLASPCVESLEISPLSLLASLGAFVRTVSVSLSVFSVCRTTVGVQVRRCRCRCRLRASPFWDAEVLSKA